MNQYRTPAYFMVVRRWEINPVTHEGKDLLYYIGKADITHREPYELLEEIFELNNMDKDTPIAVVDLEKNKVLEGYRTHISGWLGMVPGFIDFIIVYIPSEKRLVFAYPLMIGWNILYDSDLSFKTYEKLRKRLKYLDSKKEVWEHNRRVAERYLEELKNYIAVPITG